MTLDYNATMEKKLNIELALQALQEAGLSQTALADRLGVSKEAVSQWFLAKSFPRPGKLLQLGKLLDLSFDQLVIKSDPFTPKVAFRKMKGTKTTEKHISKAQDIGRFLRNLVPYLPFDILEVPPVLKVPSCDYDYLHKVTSKIRKDINLEPTDTLDFKHLIRRFRSLQTVVVPVMWGAKQRHENAVHIYLPDSQTTWVYLNLDVNIHDFKFWMAHELGHCLSPSLEGDEAENFADAFAGALLFSHELAKNSYEAIIKQSTMSAKINQVLAIANDHLISPYTVIGQVNRYALFDGLEEIDLSKGFNGAVTNFNKRYKNVSEALFASEAIEKKDLEACEYISGVEDAFETPFFELLRQYLKAYSKGPGFIQSVLDVSLLDARSIHKELT